jgi:hypothetical protein
MNAFVRFSSLRIAFTAVLWCCAMLMQSVGLLHAYVHPHDPHVHRAAHLLSCGSSDESSSADADCAAVATAPDAAGWLHALFAGHDSGSAGCTLFDQLTHADLLHDLPVMDLAFAAPFHPDAVHAAWHHATQVTGFLARAPPAIG